jgi:hypothetical protein
MGRRYSYQPGRGGQLTADSLIRAFRQEAYRQRLLVKKAELTRNRLVFIVSALRTLLADEHFVTLLRAEGLDSMPRYLADRVQAVAPHGSWSGVEAAFKPKTRVVAIEAILPVKRLASGVKASRR